MKPKHRSKGLTAVSLVLLFIAALAVFALIWALKTFADLTLDKIAIQLSLDLEGVSTDFYYSALLWVALPAALVVAAGALLLRKTRRSPHPNRVPACIAAVAVLAIGAAVGVAWNQFEAGYFLGSNYSTFIDDHYVDPNTVKLTFPEKKRNLIYIYLESMETTYADLQNGGGFDFNCIPELTTLAQENEDFSGDDEALNGGHSLTGGTWTIGAMISHTSGLPMKNGGNGMSATAAFFPNMTNIGDILAANGYRNIFMLGSDATFGGRTSYYKTHGDFEIHDLIYAREAGLIPEDYFVWWGFEDSYLFDFAKKDLLSLAKGDAPFSYVMLTVDTHFENGYVCDLCRDEFGGNQYANVMACSSRQVAEFVEWIKQQDFYEDTAIVLVGDRNTMDVDFCDDVSAEYDRRVYTAFINPAARSTGERRTFSTLDLFPTTLAALGVDIPGNRLALGTNLFSAEQTLCEQYGTNQFNEELKPKSKLTDTLQSVDTDVLASLITVTERIDDDGMLEVAYDSLSFDFDRLSVTVRGADGKVRALESIIDEKRLIARIDLTQYAPDELLDIDLTYREGRKSKLVRRVCYNPAMDNTLDGYAASLKGTGYDVLIAGKYDYTKVVDLSGIQPLEALGLRHIGEVVARDSYYAHISADGSLDVEHLDAKLLKYEGTLSDGTPFTIQSGGDMHGDIAEISIAGINYSLNGKGLNFVVYDPQTGRVVDCAWFNTARAINFTSEMGLSEGENTDLTITEKDTAFIERAEVHLDSGDRTQRVAAQRQEDGSFTATLQSPDRDTTCTLTIYVAGEAGGLVPPKSYTGKWGELAEMFTPFPNELNLYLKRLQNTPYDILFAVADDAYNGLTSQNRALMKALGCRRIDELGYRESYYAYISADRGLVAEDLGARQVEYSGELSDGASLWLSSAALYYGDQACVEIDQTEYSPKGRALNIVVYDPRLHQVVNRTYFDTHTVIDVDVSIDIQEDGAATLTLGALDNEPSQHVDVWLDDGSGSPVQRLTALRQDDGSYVASLQQPEDQARCALSVFIQKKSGNLLPLAQYDGAWSSLKRTLSDRRRSRSRSARTRAQGK